MGSILHNKLGAAAAIIIIVFLLAANQSHASRDELTLFDQGYGYYLAYEPERAVESFRIFLDEFPTSSAKDAALYWLGRSLESLRRYEEAKRTFERLKEETPDSPFTRHADKELEKIDAPETKHEIDRVVGEPDSEVEQLRAEKAQTKEVLTQLTEERDALKLLLEQEKSRSKTMEAEANRFDGELKEILARLQALRKAQENDSGSTEGPVNQSNEPSAVAPNVSKDTIPEVERTSIPNDAVLKPEHEESTQVAFPRTDKAYPVMQQSYFHTLELVATDETWISVTIDGRDARERLLKPGSRITWTANKGFSITIGNAGGTKVLFNGKDIGPLGSKGKVVKLRLPPMKPSPDRQQPSKVL